MCLCFSRTYDSSVVHAYQALARVFSLLFSPHDVSVHESSRNTSLDPDSRTHIEGVHPKERVTQFGTPGYSCEFTANFVEGNHQPPLRRPLAPRGLGHLPDALSQSKELPTRRSLTNLFPNYRRLHRCNPRPLTLGRELIPHPRPHQALQRSTNLTRTLSRCYRKTQITTSCRTHTHDTPTDQTRSHTSVPSYPRGRPTTQRTASRRPKSMPQRLPSSHSPSMDRPHDGILASK